MKREYSKLQDEFAFGIRMPALPFLHFLAFLLLGAASVAYQIVNAPVDSKVTLIISPAMMCVVVAFILYRKMRVRYLVWRIMYDIKEGVDPEFTMADAEEMVTKIHDSALGIILAVVSFVGFIVLEIGIIMAMVKFYA